MITRWRQAFQSTNLWFGFVQVAGYRYSVPYGNPPQPEIDHSHAAGDLRQAQLAALNLANVGFTTTVDTGDWTNIHPPDKQWPSKRLSNQALAQVYDMDINAYRFPVFAGATLAPQATDGTLTVTIAIRLQGGQPASLTTAAPVAATQSTTLNKSTSVPRNRCITDNSGFGLTFPQDCGYPSIEGVFANGTAASLNATATVGADKSSLVLTARAPSGFKATATSYGRASWPTTVFYDERGDKLPVIPWFSNFSCTDPSAPPL